MVNALPDPILPASEETLRQLQKAESIGQLVEGVGHDFNNSLQTVMVSLEMLRKLIAAGRYGETEQFIVSAIESVQQAAALNQRFVRFARRRPPAPRALSLNAPISDMEDLLRRSLPNTFNIILDLAADLWETRCDCDDVEAILANLVLNAHDAKPAGGTITIRTMNTDNPPEGLSSGQYVCMIVSDAATGMSHEAVRRLARKYGGGVRIESEPGRGTSVAVFLRRHRD